MTEPESLPRRSVEVALARMEAKLDVAIAQHTGRLNEHDRQITEVKADVAKVSDRVAVVERAQIAADARDGRDDQAQGVHLTRAQLVALWASVAAMVTGAVVSAVLALTRHA